MAQVLHRCATATDIGPETPTATSGIASSKRMLSVDVLRGLCVAGMVLVNFPADWVLRYHQLGHAEWDGPTATDMMFPAFLLLSGFSMVYSFASRSQRGETRGSLARHVLLRSVILLGLGLILNAFPSFNWHMLHIFGVLQRIAFCYLVGGLLVLGTSRRRVRFEVNIWAVVGFMVLVLAGVWAAVRFVDVPVYGSWRFDHNGNLGAVIDRAIFGNRHLSDWGGPERMWDADGLLSCITSIPNLLLGVLAAVWVRRGGSVAKTMLGLLVLAAALIGVALLLNPYLVINRKLWTDSFTLLSGGVSLGIFAMFYLWLDGAGNGKKKVQVMWWQTPALVYGSNAILGFVIYTLLLGFHGLYRLPGAHAPAYWLPGATYAKLCQWIDPYNVSLLYGLVAVGVVMGLLWPFYQRKIFLKL
ncbi:putative acyltransferase [Granulicella aggregans]|uniref:Putative acyltransferase n=1 Tax=Granulicella aggregans TaxID=474949 RepID=A0A7W8E5Z1_9BACT|nr:heparan-alpha-glucosaminide N-acetyltransferase domain-containing protein [Granulicella aggregans]MBB5060663.1 putative acyltransferase [Granulicella aggregans]